MTHYRTFQSSIPDHAARTCWALLVAVLLLAGGTLGQEIDDQDIADAIQDELIFDRTVPANNIDISVQSGVATLTGEVDNILAHDRAERLAETVRGVRSVVNRISVEPSVLRSDMAIARDIESALLTDPATDSYEVEVVVDNGEATLTGTVESWAEKDLAGTVAKGVRGVTGLVNMIEVQYADDRMDAEITTDIEQALRWDTLVDDGLIDVTVRDGAVTLSGAVGSAAEKRRARVDAWVAGVESVDASDLTVERWARDDDLRQGKYEAVDDADIANAIQSALRSDPRVMAFNVTPEAREGVVTLRGAVDNLRAKRAAGQVARSTVGVRQVHNRLTVRPPDVLTDDQIAENVRDALQRDPLVEQYDIDVDVINSTVYLRGEVDSYQEKWQADDIASRANGVVDVRNYLDVQYAGPIAYDPYVYDLYVYDYDWYDYEPITTFTEDAEIAEEIEDELWWSPFVDSDDVSVMVVDGTATLTGTVDSLSEHQAATENAYEGGAVWVDNNLVVE